MKSIGIKFTAFIIAVIFTMACTTLVFAKTGDVSLISDVQKRSVSILGQLASDGGVNYIVNIAPFDEDIIVFSDTNPPKDSRLFTTYSEGYIGRDAGAGETIYFADTFSDGHYSMYIHYNEGGEAKRIIRSFYVLNPNDNDTKALLANLNAATTKEQFAGYLSSSVPLARVGVYDKDIASSGDYPLYHAFNVRPDGGYDIGTLQTAIMSGDVIYIIKEKGVASLDKNTNLLGAAYTGDYQTLKANEKVTLDQLLKTTDYTKASLANVFAEMVNTAEIKTCTNPGDMEDEVKAHISELGVNMNTGSDYSKISDTKKYMVFERMVLEKVNFKSLADIKTSFDKHVKDILGDAPTQDGGGMGGGTGGGGGGGSAIISGPQSGDQSSSGNILNPDTLPVPSKPFNDINGHFAQNDIEKLASLGFINGHGDGSYRPYNNITRAEYAKLIAVMFGITGGSARFNDINESDWFAPFVNSLAELGIITGYNGYFNPNDNIKREDAVLMLHRVSKLYNIKGSYADGIVFSDEAQISSYAKEAIGEFSKMGIINGDGVNFYPLNNITRGEVAAVLSRLYDIYVGGEA